MIEQKEKKLSLKKVSLKSKVDKQLLTYSGRLIKKWSKEKKHTLVNSGDEKNTKLVKTMEGKDSKTGHFVRVVMIESYPLEIVAGYLDQLDELVTKEGATLRKTIRYIKSDVKWNWAMKNKYKRLEKSVSEMTITDPGRQSEIDARDALVSLQESIQQGKSKLVEVSTFLTISAETTYQLDAAESNMRDWIDDLDGRLDNFFSEQLEALIQTSPVSDKESPSGEFFNKHHYGRVITDSVAARTYLFTSGSFSDGQGLYFGRRTEDGGFCFINLCDPNDPRAQNLMVLGKTGQGKSYFLKALVVSLLEEGVHVFVFDLDGEWRDLCEEVGGVYIDHTADVGRYFEPLAIMPSIPEIDEECVRYNRSRYQRAIDTGIRTCSMLADGLTKTELFEAGEAVRRVFQNAGIEKNKQETWDGPYSGERPTIKAFFRDVQQDAQTNEDAKSLYDKIKIYFIGIYDGVFESEEPLTFQNAPLVVYKVGSGETEGNEKDEKAKLAQLKMSMAFDVVNSNIQKLRFEGAYFSAVLVDEGQRQLKNRELKQAVFDWYTAIRKWNGMMILGANTPAIILDTAEGVGMWENTNVKVYFYMEHSAVRMLSQHSDVPEEVQDRIRENEDTNCYVLEYHKKYDELFMHVPEDEHVLYKTRGLKEAI
ncbi:VirB4 family type IV secretion system protein [Paenibacillus sp. FSL L8-0494]|uniref:VirB4 family type IV secretion system protein n=1 Tax=Paenibacillus sp. FSL L8-0494 TaxID=2975352 RepID=UPI0030FAEE8C